MPGKSRQAKGKHSHLSKKSRAKQRQGTTNIQPPAASEVPRPAASINTPSIPRVTTTAAKLKTVQYPYITTELRRIIILAGIILVILIVLALVLS